MSFLKKNLIFTIVCIICVLSFCAGAYFAFAQQAKIDRAKQSIQMAEAQLNSLRYADPAPSEANLEASARNVAELQAQLISIREDLQRGSNISASSSGIEVMAGLQQYISKYQREAAQRIDVSGEPRPVELPADFAFGFEQYIDEATAFEDGSLNEALDKQRQILSHLLEKLFTANLASLVSVERELIEQSGEDEGRGFQIDPAISARVPDALDTFAFSISFNAYTDSLRIYLNELAKFDLPIVVRSIEVARPAGKNTTAAPSKNKQLDSIFGVFNNSTSEAEPAEAQQPVISENISTFTLILEFIEVVHPDDSADNEV